MIRSMGRGGELIEELLHILDFKTIQIRFVELHLEYNLI